ncbi:fusaric acid resistance family protein [Micromonospora violae]|uniref:Fusaric acid resistance family protein n=1 Tax=Micromonospora violae TaxID=1278207 RepID=A0A4Q7UMU4_9ACTN|nr:FUSC family protein [Micromonospora violae]RZT82314.1 fusaric acid resistance family protein [Micromonospora violae]
MADDRPPADRDQSRLDETAERTVRRVRHRSGQAGRIRARQWEVTLVISIQAGLAAAIAALLANMLLGPGSHVFAPAAAVGTIATAIGQRARRTFELLAGVALGIVIGDTLRFLLGSGPWQTGVVVTMAIAAALLVAGKGGPLVGQAGGTAVLIATLAPTEHGLEVPRIFDALLGGAVGLVVVALLLPINPMRVLDRAAAPIFEVLCRQLAELSQALRERDGTRTMGVLDRLRGTEDDLGRLHDTLSGAEEVVTIAPVRWHRRQQYHRYARSANHLERLLLDSRAMARWSTTALQYQEPIPTELADAMGRLGQAVTVMRTECKVGDDPRHTRRLIEECADLAGQASARGVSSFGESLVTGLRTSASDLLRAAGCEPDDANRVVRRAAGAGEGKIHPPARRQMRRARPTRAARARRRAHLDARTRNDGRAGLPARERPAR